MANEQNSIFQSFKDKSNQAQRVLVIFLGASFFFFFMILLPYFSLRVDSYNLSNLHDLSDTIFQNVNYFRQKLVSLSAGSDNKTQIGGQYLTLSNYSKLLTSSKNDSTKLENLTAENLTDNKCGSPQPENRASFWFVCNLNYFMSRPQANIQFDPTRHHQNEQYNKASICIFKSIKKHSNEYY